MTAETMTFSEIALAYVNLLWTSFQSDVVAYSQWWMYAFALVPAIGYSIFFVAKWAFLTAPFWIPLNLVFGGLRRATKHYHPKKKDVKETTMT
jgi:hypothetical protein